MRLNPTDDRSYLESQLISRPNASKSVLPPLESNGRKQMKSVASKNGNNACRDYSIRTRGKYSLNFKV